MLGGLRRLSAGLMWGQGLVAYLGQRAKRAVLKGSNRAGPKRGYLRRGKKGKSEQGKGWLIREGP